MSNGSKLQNTGANIIRYGLALVLVWIGCLKFTSYEAMGIEPLVQHSPLLSWMLNIADINGVAKFIGFSEIVFGVLIGLRKFFAKASAIGSIGGCVTFFVTLTFLFTTPPVIQMGYSFPFLSPMPGQFLIKDIVFFGASVYTVGEALSVAVIPTLNMSKKAYA